MISLDYFKITHYTGAVALSNAAYGQGSGSVLLTSLQCAGNETFLVNCSGAGFLNSQTCQHTRDAGVMCQRKQCNNIHIICIYMISFYYVLLSMF